MYPVRGLQNIDIMFSVVIELKDRDVVDVMEACCVDSLSLISVCQNVCVFVYTSDKLAVVFNRLFYGVVKMSGR